MSSLILSLKEAFISFGNKNIFENLNLNIKRGDKIALVGKNGTGKSTLMNTLSGSIEIEKGKRWFENNIKINMLSQELDHYSDIIAEDFILEGTPLEEIQIFKKKIDMIANSLDIDIKKKINSLSGGQLRRLALVKVLSQDSDIIMLDEPTNHLDLYAIEWLENYLQTLNNTLICVSHDKTFLNNISKKVFWIDRGQVRVSPTGFKNFDNWYLNKIDEEERQLKNRRQNLTVDIEWAKKGVKARVKRNIKRLQKIKHLETELEKDEKSFIRSQSKVTFDIHNKNQSKTKTIFEFFKVSKCFNLFDSNIKILNNFDIRIKKGEKVGVIGKNGSGKSTFLKLIMKEMQPDSGKIKIFKNIEFSYFDQQRSSLLKNDTVKNNMCPSGSDFINVNGKETNVFGYLKKFSIEPKVILENVSSLSGGQKNKLLLAKTLANPKSCLILDEPTNDLDIETLEILLQMLLQYKGTMIVVSHDRYFLDRLVSKTVLFKGNGNVEVFNGGFSKYNLFKEMVNKKNKKKQITKNKVTNNIKKKLSYKYEYEFKNIPKIISSIENEISNYENLLNNKEFYEQDKEKFFEVTKKLKISKDQLNKLEIRWYEILKMKDSH